MHVCLQCTEASIRSPVGTTDCQNRLGVRLGQKPQAISILTNTDAYPEYASFLQQRTWCFVMRSDEVPIEIRGCVTDRCDTSPAGA